MISLTCSTEPAIMMWLSLQKSKQQCTPPHMVSIHSSKLGIMQQPQAAAALSHAGPIQLGVRAAMCVLYSRMPSVHDWARHSQNSCSPTKHASHTANYCENAAATAITGRTRGSCTVDQL